MGNCLVHEEKAFETDVKILLQARLQEVNMFPGRAISETLPAITYGDPAMSMRHRRLHHLLPSEKQLVKTGAEDGFIRIKMVMTKRQFQDMLRKGGVSPDGMLSFGQRAQSNVSGGASGEKRRSMEWRPTLRSIPEGDDFCLE